MPKSPNKPDLPDFLKNRKKTPTDTTNKLSLKELNQMAAEITAKLGGILTTRRPTPPKEPTPDSNCPEHPEFPCTLNDDLN